MHGTATTPVIQHPAQTSAGRQNTFIYWGLQLAGWGCYFWGQASGEVLIGEVPWRQAIYLWGTVCLKSIFLTHMLRAVSKANDWFALPPPTLLFKAAFSIVLLGAIEFTVTVITTLAVYGTPVSAMTASIFHKLPLGLQMLNQFFGQISMLGLWVVIYFGIMMLRRRHRAELRHAQLSEALQEAELQLLKFQLNPHFLFNALNGVRALIADEPAKAQDAVTQLARTLRYTLAAGDAELVTLAREVEMVNDYLALEGLRLAGRLEVVREIEPDADNVCVPAMLLQTLAENAIKHGIAPLKHGGTLRISARVVNKELLIEIRNPRPIGDDHVPREGVGLRNTSARLRLLFGSAADVNLDLLDPERAVVRVRLPA